jgi:hypothetical protein
VRPLDPDLYLEIFELVEGQDRHSIPPPDAPLAQAGGQAIGSGVNLSERKGAGTFAHAYAIREAPRRVAHEVGYLHDQLPSVAVSRSPPHPGGVGRPGTDLDRGRLPGKAESYQPTGSSTIYSSWGTKRESG